jgi:two-component system, LytTR family, response regulator
MSNKNTIIIVEDEKHSQEALKNMLIEFCADVDVVAMASNVTNAVQLIRKFNPDIVFMDIELNPGTGFDVLTQTRDLRYAVIFTTAFEQYAIQAIKFSSVDYLLKPVDLEELQNALDKARKRIADEKKQEQVTVLLNNLALEHNPNRKICLASLEGLEFYNVSDIIYCEANGAYTNFILKENIKVMVSKNLKEYENLLSGQNFLRVHSRHLINLHEVKKYIRSDGGSIIMNNGDVVYLSPRKKDEFLQRMSMLA